MKRMIRIPIKWLVLATSSCPLSGVLLCVVISMWKDFEGVNRTHCNVYNFLPSVSASIGNYTPQRYIWRILVALHSSPRIFFALLWYSWHSQDIYNWNTSPGYRVLCRASLGLSLTEVFCLVGLTFVSSNENYDVHEKCFIFFIVFAILHMITTCCLCHRRKAPMHQYSYRLKIFIFATFLTSIVSFTYLFGRHNRYCEPYVYTIFAFFEYLCIVSNICFHSTLILDCGDQPLVIFNHQMDDDMLINCLTR